MYINEFGSLIQDLLGLSSLFLGVVYIPREANTVAHGLAKYTLRSEEDIV